MSDNGPYDDGNGSPTPWGYWTGGGDAGSYWVEEAPPANAGYVPVNYGGGDAGISTSWEPVAPVAPGASPLDYGSWSAPDPGSVPSYADNTALVNSLYRELLGRDADPTGLSVNKGMSADTIRQSILASAEYRARQGSGGGGGSTPFVPVNPAAPASGGGGGGITRNPVATLNTNLGTNPGLMPVNPYFQTTNDVQSQYSWAPRSEANPLQAGQQNWGIQQPNRGFDVNQFIAEMLGPQNQSQAAKLPTPFPGR
jgi:hypothetical protein